MQMASCEIVRKAELQRNSPTISRLRFKEHSCFDDLKLSIKKERIEFDKNLKKEDFREDEYDDNGMNLLHYCIWNDYLSTVLKLLELGYDVTWKMQRSTVTESLSPMELILQKYKEYMHKDVIYNRKNDKTYIMVQNILRYGDIQIEKSYLDVAVNFPYFLEAILEDIPEDEVPEYYKILPEKVNSKFNYEFVNMGFVELMLTHCDGIILKMINNQWPECHTFLKQFKDKFNQRPLHSAAKLFKPHIVEKLMDSRLSDDYNAPDKIKQTSITIVLAKWEQLRFFASIKGDSLRMENKKGAVEVIAKILEKIPEEEQIRVIQQNYHGMPAIEYDIKSGNGIIVKAILKLQDAQCKKLLSNNYNLGNIFHIAARYGFPLMVFEEEKLQSDDFLELFDQVKSSRKPCDYAIEYGHTKFVEEACNSKKLRNVWVKDELAEVAAIKDYRKDWSQEIKTACRLGNLKALHLLQYQASIDIKYTGNWELLYIACKHGHASIVDYLLSTARMQPENEKEENEFPSKSVLISAADNDASDCVKLLLDHNFSVNIEDENHDNILCRAIKRRRQKAVMAILTHENGKGALHFCHETSNLTPLRLLVNYLPDIAIWVLNNQITKDENDERIRYDYKLIDDLDHLSNRTRFHSLLLHCYNYCHSRSPVPTQFYTASFHTISQLWRQDSLEYISSPTPEETENAKVKQPEYEPTNHILYVMLRGVNELMSSKNSSSLPAVIQNKPINILQHRVVKNVITHYWKSALKYWIGSRIIHFLNTIILTLFILNLPHPKGNICTGNNTNNMTSGTNDGHDTFLFCFSSILIVFSIISLILNIVTLWSTGLKQICLLFTTFKRYRVLLEIILAICILPFVAGYYSTRDWCAKSYQWNLGAICIFLSWISVLISLKVFSSNINKLFTIINQFMKIIILPAVLLVAFFLPFLMLFTSPWPGQIFGPFQNVNTPNIVNILLLGIGGDYFGPHDGDYFEDYPFASYLIFVGFMIIVTVLFNNLLIALAVGDLTDLQNKAELESYRLKISIIIDMLDLLYPFFKKKQPDEIEKAKSSEKEWREEVRRYEEGINYNKKLSDLILNGTDEEIIKADEKLIKHDAEIIKKELEEIKVIKEEMKEINKRITAFQESAHMLCPIDN